MAFLSSLRNERGKRSYTNPADILPLDLLEDCKKLEFWRHNPYNNGLY